MTAPALALLAALGPSGGLAGAACTGRAPMFDADLDGETGEARKARHDRARGLCGDCGVLKVCRASLETLPPETAGIWAGVLLTAKGHR